jgi:hypothetical protein
MKEQQQTKYPWHLAPDWAMWAATDEDGEAEWYEKEPEQSWTFWAVRRSKLESIGYFPELRADWQNSLEKRPST